MKKKLLFGLAAAGTALAMIPLFAAFEAHIINVTAKIENALAVNRESIEFGTVFPEEHLFEKLIVTLSNSFLDEDRVDDVTYVIKQKPKCQRDPGTDPTLPLHRPVDSITHQCPEGYSAMPLLCPYLSKEKEDDDKSLTTDLPPFDTDVEALHGDPLAWNTNDPLNIANGKLTKQGDDVEDRWDIDLLVPCFVGECAQDGKIPPKYQLDPELKDEDGSVLMGCDLWVEVNGVSLPTEDDTTLTVTKTVTNDNGGNNVIGDFPLFIDGSPVSSGVAVAVTPGAHVVSETGPSGYEATFGGDCDADGDVTVPPGGSATCTIENNDIAPSITLAKSVINDGLGTSVSADFTMTVNGTIVPSGTSIVVDANTPNTIDESDPALVGVGYSFVSLTGDPECPAALAGTATLDEGEAITCTITNNDD